jgi:hypothetical protein
MTTIPKKESGGNAFKLNALGEFVEGEAPTFGLFSDDMCAFF